MLELILNTVCAPCHHEHVIEHHHLLRIVNEGEVAPAEPVVEEVVPQTTAGAYFITGYSEAQDSAHPDQGKPPVHLNLPSFINAYHFYPV